MTFGIPPYICETPSGTDIDQGYYPYVQPTGFDFDEYKPDNELSYLQYLGFLTELTVAGEWREIVSWFSNGQRYIRRCKVIWSTEALKQMPVAGQDGVYYMGDILLTLRKSDAGGIPKPGLKIESPPGLVWSIVDVVDDAGTYALKLVRNS
jgi:hypothetical protein